MGNGRPGLRAIASCLLAGLLGGCVQTQWQGAGYGPTQTLLTADQTMDVELTDRVHRLDRLSGLQGVVAPSIEEVIVPANRVPGAMRPIPVIRVTFNERDFFNPGSPTPRPQAAQALQIMAEAMRRDVPDVRMTVLGHTDATGSVAANEQLSRMRALGVTQILVADGANPGQLDAVAIGQAQPIAPNNTEAGRARNRRVEFLISPSEQANLAAVSRRPVNPAFLAVGSGPVRSAHAQVAVMKVGYTGPADFSEAPNATKRAGTTTLTTSGPRLAVGDDETGSPVAGETVRPLVAGGAGTGLETGSPVQPSARYTP